MFIFLIFIIMGLSLFVGILLSTDTIGRLTSPIGNQYDFPKIYTDKYTHAAISIFCFNIFIKSSMYLFIWFMDLIGLTWIASLFGYLSYVALIMFNVVVTYCATGTLTALSLWYMNFRGQHPIHLDKLYTIVLVMIVSLGGVYVWSSSFFTFVVGKIYE